MFHDSGQQRGLAVADYVHFRLFAEEILVHKHGLIGVTKQLAFPARAMPAPRYADAGQSTARDI